MTESLLWTIIFVQINFQISQNDTVWSDIDFPLFNDMCKWQIMNFRPNCAILADLEIIWTKIIVHSSYSVIFCALETRMYLGNSILRVGGLIELLQLISLLLKPMMYCWHGLGHSFLALVWFWIVMSSKMFIAWFAWFCSRQMFDLSGL